MFFSCSSSAQGLNHAIPERTLRVFIYILCGVLLLSSKSTVIPKCDPPRPVTFSEKGQPATNCEKPLCTVKSERLASVALASSIDLLLFCSWKRGVKHRGWSSHLLGAVDYSSSFHRWPTYPCRLQKSRLQELNDESMISQGKACGLSSQSSMYSVGLAPGLGGLQSTFQAWH